MDKFCYCDDEKLFAQQHLFVPRHLLLIYMLFISEPCLKISCCALEKNSGEHSLNDAGLFRFSKPSPSKVHLGIFFKKNFYNPAPSVSSVSHLLEFHNLITSDNFNFIVENIILMWELNIFLEWQ